MSRHDGRAQDELREIKIERNYLKTAEGSVLVSFGDTKVIVTAKPDYKVPPWLKNSGQGWVTAEYSMLPGSSIDRIKRDRKSGPSGRSAEIQRLIGRSLRAMVDLKQLPEICIQLDCDVIQADGGTRTASITGAYVALYDCLRYLEDNAKQLIAEEKINPEKVQGQNLFPNGLPISNQVAAVSVGIVNGKPVLDLDYPEDSSAQADANFVLTAEGKIIEIQGTAEDGPFQQDEFLEMLSLAQKGIGELCSLQSSSLKN